MPDYLIGGSPAIRRIRASLTKLSVDTSPLVIIGEPGVGKSLLSSRIHTNSLLKDRELETVNFKILSDRDQRVRLLGGSPPELPTTRRSVLELPTTVVLKHLDKASSFLQERLAEAILNKTIIRLGTKEQRPIRGKMIFIFNKNLITTLKESRLFIGLFKLLAKYPTIEIPSLKKRKEDIPELAQYFFTQFQMERRKNIDRKFMELLLRHRWEMNILELKSFIKSLGIPPDETAIQQRERIELAQMNLMIDEGKEFQLRDALSSIGNSLTKRTWRKHNKSNTITSQALGMTEGSVRSIVR